MPGELQHAGVSVQAMADELGVSRNTVGNYLNRRTEISRSGLIVWALRTGVPMRWLETEKTPTGPGPDGGLDVERAWRDSNSQPSDPKVLPFRSVAA